MTRDRFAIAAVLGLLVALLGVPFIMASGRQDARGADDARRLIIVTPHTQQIRDEFGQAFSEWHLREYAEPVRVDFRTPGGTSEIRRQLEAQFRAAAAAGQIDLPEDPAAEGPTVTPGVIGYDLMFGGGSYDHSTLKAGIRVKVEGADVDLPMSIPADIDPDTLDQLFGPNTIGTQQLYDPGRYWIGTALSSFGIVYNRPVYERLGLEPPRNFRDLTDPRLRGWLALADPRLSGSITTTFDSILGNQGWEDGWKTLRAMSGNARYFTNSATKPPLDVGAGEAAAGLAIDFYGRGQAQVLAEGGKDRLGYVEPKGAVYIDADPVSIIRGAPDPELANRFVRFTLTEEAQALWQFPALRREAARDNPPGPADEPMGPQVYELRRMPIRRVMYEKYLPHFMDQVDPFELASDISNPGWRTGVQMMMGAFGIDSADQCRAAWAAIARAESDPDFPKAELQAMRDLFFSFPKTPVTLLRNHHAFQTLSPATTDALPPDRTLTLDAAQNLLRSGALSSTPDAEAELNALLATDPRPLPFTQSSYAAVRNEWRNPAVEARCRIAYTTYFRDAYADIQRMHAELSRAPTR